MANMNSNTPVLPSHPGQRLQETQVRFGVSGQEELMRNEKSNICLLHPFPLRLIEARVRKNLTQKELAGMAGVSRGTVERLETGHGKIESLKKVAKALGVSLRRLLA